MLGSLTGMFNKLKDNKLVQNITGNISENYSKLKGQVLPKFQIIEVLPQIYHTGFPEKSYIPQLKAHIGQSQFQIWNISEYHYDKQIESTIGKIHEQGQIHHLCFTMYSNPPFYELMLAINKISHFVQCNKSNKVYVHCQDNKVRSAILLSCYIFKHQVEDISEAILLVNKALRVNLEDEGKKSTYKNLHILFKNFVNYHHNPQIINRHKLRLLKFIVNQPPSLKINNQVMQLSKKIRLCVQIKCGEETIVKQIFSESTIEGGLMCIVFTKEVIVGDQFLVIVKYLHEGLSYNMLRIQLNSNFIYQCFARIHQQHIDSSSFAYYHPKRLMHIDFIFESQSQLSKLALLSPKDSPIEQNAKESEKEQKKETKEVNKNEGLIQSTKVQSQALASLNQDLLSEPSSTGEQFEAKIMTFSEASGVVNIGSQEEQQQDLQDYLSRLQEQA